MDKNISKAWVRNVNGLYAVLCRAIDPNLCLTLSLQFYTALHRTGKKSGFAGEYLAIVDALPVSPSVFPNRV
jgi:hypothetical protein